MAFHEGRLYVTGGDGEIIDMIATPPRSAPTNLCFQGDMMWVTFGITGQSAAYRL